MQYDATNRFDLGGTMEGLGRDEGSADLETTHPNALMVYWELYSRTQQWTSAHTIAEAIVSERPFQPVGWIYRSFALQRLGRFREALTGLTEAAEKFPEDWRIAYNAACCCCQLGDVGGAWDWLDQATELGNSDVIKSSVLDDPEFRPLWERLGKI